MTTTNEIFGLPSIAPHVEGLIRFTREVEVGSPSQQPHFELLTRVHSETPVPGEVPRMITHPLSEKIMGQDNGSGDRRLLAEIPIRLMFDKPENNLCTSYKAFERNTGKLVCCGNGKTATQRSQVGECAKSTTCRGPENCTFASNPQVTCQLHVRLKVQVEGSEDHLAFFEFQSSGINSYRTLSAKLQMFSALFGSLKGLPLRLTSWAKSSMGSDYQPFYCANIELKEGVDLLKAKQLVDEYRNKYAGINFDAMEAIVAEMEQLSSQTLIENESIVSCWAPATESPSTHQVTSTSNSGSELSLEAKMIGAREQATKSLPVPETGVGSAVTAPTKSCSAQLEVTKVQPMTDATIPPDQPLPVAESPYFQDPIISI